MDDDASPDGDIAVGGADQSTSDASHAADCEPRSMDVMLFSVVRSTAAASAAAPLSMSVRRVSLLHRSAFLKR